MVSLLPLGTEIVNWPSMSVAAPDLRVSENTDAPINGSSSVFERTVPCTVMFYACAPIAANSRKNANRIDFFMSIMIGKNF